MTSLTSLLFTQVWLYTSLAILRCMLNSDLSLLEGLVSVYGNGSSSPTTTTLPTPPITVTFVTYLFNVLEYAIGEATRRPTTPVNTWTLIARLICGVYALLSSPRHAPVRINSIYYDVTNYYIFYVVYIYIMISIVFTMMSLTTISSMLSIYIS